MNANVVSLLFENVKQHPGKVAVISKTEEITYSQLWQRIQGTLGFLESMGLQRGNKVAIYLADGIDFASCYYAILMGGGIVIPLASCLKQYEISAILRNCMPSLMITELDLWDKATSGQQFETHVIFIDQIASRTDLLLDRNVEPCRPDSVASINYTYNGTGYPKGAELTHGNYLSAFEGLVGHLGLRKEDVFLAPLPMAHIYSLALGNLVPMLSGATLVIADSYYPAALCKLVNNHRVTVMLSVPTLLYKFKEESTLRQLAYPSLRLMISGGEYMPAELCVSLVDRFRIPVVQGYGLTECMPIISNVPNGPNKPGSLGIPGRSDIFVRIVDSEMRSLKPGAVGEILVKSPTVMKGYHGLPRDTEEVLCDGWLRTGDLGSIDEDGFLHFAGLKKRIFNLTGMKVDPTEVESVGRLHPCVKDVTVHEETIAGILPRKLLVAQVSLHQHADVDEKDLRAFYKEKVSWYKVPSRMIITTLEEA